MDRNLLINDTEVSEYDLYYASIPPVPSPEQDVEHVEIKGRHGSLTKKYGFKDISYPITFYFYENAVFKKAFRKAKPILFAAKTLRFNDDPDVHYRVKSINIDTAENDIIKFGRFTVEFILMPFQYETNPTQSITTRTVFNNPAFESEPYIKATCSGNGKIIVNGNEIQITGINGTIELDSELMNAYRKTTGNITNLNNHMVGDFPVFQNGNNVVEFSGDISKLEINPRWRWV
ncbi:phage tail domain-containing protein [Oceanobacillus neutriphilus]|uniref:Siphovirus-type tail component RIFT-related domain-containing protein n=1 Tax=Oceanobacillus neutriphilus TaxID=531815 RepID=A0ABQ2NMP2_9BACI|nr:phage tail domain-containing protein [Oceanobacillus neutriphilus]GGP07269.1 hypothetical protein GCM10011346_02580 [Oceanobacillus neutriphilus]